jgi:hypothetical protein
MATTNSYPLKRLLNSDGRNWKIISPSTCPSNISLSPAKASATYKNPRSYLQVTHKGKTSTPHDLLMANKIFALGSKILCQHNDPKIICSKRKALGAHLQEWFSTSIIGAVTTNTLDWSTKKFKPWWTYEKGNNTATPTDIQKMASTLGKSCRKMTDWLHTSCPVQATASRQFSCS